MYSTLPILGMPWRCSWGTWRSAIHGLRMAPQLHLLRMWQESLLQTPNPFLRHLYCSSVGLRLCYDCLLSRLVLDPMYARLLHLYRLLAENIRQYHPLLPWTNLWGLWHVPEQNQYNEEVIPIQQLDVHFDYWMPLTSVYFYDFSSTKTSSAKTMRYCWHSQDETNDEN